MKKLLILFPILFLLQGCVAVVLGGVAAAGGVTYYNKKQVKTYYSDSNIQFQINQRINHTPLLQNNTHIVVTVYEGVVLLVGQVNTAAKRIKADQLSQGIPGVKRIYNELTVSGPTSSLTRSSDGWITSKIKSDMLITKGLKSRFIKVVTENGVVYLMGRVPSQQATIAANIARRVQGVQKVVTLFETQ